MGTPTMGKNKNAGKPRNYALECGVYRFGKGKMYHKKAIYKFNKKAAPVKAADPKPTFVEKPVKGAKKGKRVVGLKQLASGLVLITGPMKLNGCPMRRVNQIYLLATANSIDVSAVALPETINDEYFKHAK